MADILTVLSSMATRRILATLVADLNAAGQNVRLQSVGGVDAVKRVRGGEVFDLIILASDAISALADEGFVRGDSVRTFACSPTAVAVPSGQLHAAKLDEGSLKALVAGAKRIAVSTGPSGKSIERLFQAWGTPDLSQRLVQAPPGVPVARLLASGDADIGFQQLSELLGEPGIEIVGIVPASLQPMTVFAGGIGRHTRQDSAAQTVLRHFMSDETAALKRQCGMEPGAPVSL